MADFIAGISALPPQDRDTGLGVPFHVETYGCQMNVYDSQAITGLLLGNGFRRVADPDAAAVILLNTCSVREHAEQKVLSRIGEIRQGRRRRKMPQPVIAVCGCMAERMGSSLTKGSQAVDLVVGVDQYENLPGLLEPLLAGKETIPTAVVIGHRDDSRLVAPPELYPVNNSHLVTIHKGCDYKCTYCIVPATRGPQREKDPALILEEIRQIVRVGGREVTLLGQNVTAYRWGDMDFSGLLGLVSRIEGLEHIRFLTGHPCDMHPHLMDAIGRLGKVCPWLHLPIQSGSDRILRRMKRLYTRKQYLEMIAYARNVIPDVTFSSDFIVGFPGETEEDFCATLEVIEAVEYDQVFTFKYSERPGVPASRLADDVPVETKKERLARLMAAQEVVWARLAGSCVGQTWQARVERSARRPAGAWLLRTANNRKVIVKEPDLAVGDAVEVRISGHRNTTFLGTVSG